MKAYLELLKDIKANGNAKPDRTGTGILSVFGRQMRFDLGLGFPLLTTKKLHVRSIILELLWFLRGETNIAWLNENKCHIWDPWADAKGDLGPIYGAQWRSWPDRDGGSIDQISQVVQMIKEDPESRRMLVVAWNPADIKHMALPPCHCLFQFYVANGKLSCQLYQRSCDVFIGLPFNIASYSLLTMMIAAHCGLEPGEFVWTGGDVHLYDNHMVQVETQLTRTPLPLPKLKIARQRSSIFDYSLDDFELEGYEAYPHIKADVAV